MHFIGMKLLEKDGEVKQFFNKEIDKALKEGWKEYKPKTEPKTEDEDTEESEDGFAEMTYAQLRHLAKEKGMENTNVKKEELIAFLRGE